MELAFRTTASVLALLTLAACDLGTGGAVTAPPGVSQADYDAQIAARKKARKDFFRGPRGGATGR